MSVLPYIAAAVLMIGVAILLSRALRAASRAWDVATLNALNALDDELTGLADAVYEPPGPVLIPLPRRIAWDPCDCMWFEGGYWSPCLRHDPNPETHLAQWAAEQGDL